MTPTPPPEAPPDAARAAGRREAPSGASSASSRENPSGDAATDAPSADASGAPGRLGANLMHFARTLRAAGLPVGSGAVLDALRAVEAVGVARRDDFYWTLHAVFVRRADQRPLFDEAFHVVLAQPEAPRARDQPPPPQPSMSPRRATRARSAAA